MSSFAPPPTIISFTTSFDAPGSLAGCALSTRASRAASTAARAPGRSVTIAGEPVSLSVAITFPAYAGCFTTSASPASSNAVTSAAMLTPSCAATRGARSRPCALAEKIAAR